MTLYLKLDKQDQKVNEQTNTIAALGDTIRQHKDSEGRLVSTITSFQSQSSKDFIKLKTKDSTITELQKVVKTNNNRIKNSGSATIFTDQTNIDQSGKTTITSPVHFKLPSDTTKDLIQQYEDSSLGQKVYPNPIYEAHIPWGKWGDFRVVASKDSIHLKGFINNEYSVVVGEDSSPNLFHPFRKATPFSEVTNYNPYSYTKTLRTYQTSLPPPKTWGIGITGGYGIGRSGNSIITMPAIIIGVTKTLIRW